MQTFSKRVSMTVVKRLPKYYQYLTDLQDQHIEKISSKELAAMIDVYKRQGLGFSSSAIPSRPTAAPSTLRQRWGQELFLRYGLKPFKHECAHKMCQ